MSSDGAGSGPAAPVAEVRNLEKSYGAVRAVRGVSFSVPAGQVVGFLGPNGAGKTTVMKILTGFLAADAGEARVCGLPVEEQPLEVKRCLGYLPENNPLYPELRVRDFLGFVARARGLGRGPHRNAIERVVEATGLASVLHRSIGECSKGFRQRVGLAQALLHDPPLLILDEPTTGLDPNQAAGIRALIRELGRTKTVLLTSHVLPEVEALAERVILMAQGVVVADAPLGALPAGDGPVRIRCVIEGDAEDFRQLAAGAGARLLGAEPAPCGPGFTTGELELPPGAGALTAVGRAASRRGATLVELSPQGASLESLFRMLAGAEEAA